MNVIRHIVISGLFLFGCSSQSTHPDPISDIGTKKLRAQWVLDQNLCDPETAVYDPGQNLVIISNICAFKANGEGYLSQVGLDGKIIEAKWVTGLNAPAGMAIHNRQLVTTDLDRLHVIDLDSGEVLETLIPGMPVKAFNGLTISPTGQIFVTDSSLGQILTVKERQFTPYPDDNARFNFANGLHIQNGILYVGGEHFWKINMDSLQIEQIARGIIADVDGIESGKNDSLIISKVGGALWHLSSNGEIENWTAPGLSSTNHLYIREQDLIMIPTGYDNTVLAFKSPIVD